jgi:hypothetical protein
VSAAGRAVIMRIDNEDIEKGLKDYFDKITK